MVRRLSLVLACHVTLSFTDAVMSHYAEVVDKADYIEKFDHFFNFMQTRFNSFRKYQPLAHAMKNFSGAIKLIAMTHSVFHAEYYNENSKEYIKWILGQGDGVDPSCERYLQKLCVVIRR